MHSQISRPDKALGAIGMMSHQNTNGGALLGKFDKSVKSSAAPETQNQEPKVEDAKKEEVCGSSLSSIAHPPPMMIQ